jgi:ATP-dependent DNA helicase RecQ
LAQRANVPPYVIFSDYSLSEMASYFPQATAAFSQISGVGNFKLEKYAGEFLPIIREYCRDNDISEKPHVKAGRRSRRTAISPRTVAIAEAISCGKSIETVASDFGFKNQTIIGHLSKYLKAGGNLDAARIIELSELDSVQRQKVLDVMADLGIEALRPIYDHFDGRISYEELWILRLYYLAVE